MSKVLTFSQYFPAYHIKAREETKFVEKFCNSLGIEYWQKLKYLDLDRLNSDLAAISDEDIIAQFHRELDYNEKGKKYHTIRAGNRWKVGDKCSPRVWSGKPYNSKQIIIAPDIEIKKLWDIQIDGYKFYINGRLFYHQHFSEWHHQIEELAKNDGLSFADMMEWFKVPCQFSGQIISWSDEIQY